MKCISEKSKEIFAITLAILMFQFPMFVWNDGVICPAELFYVGTTGLVMMLFVGHFCRKE